MAESPGSCCSLLSQLSISSSLISSVACTHCFLATGHLRHRITLQTTATEGCSTGGGVHMVIHYLWHTPGCMGSRCSKQVKPYVCIHSVCGLTRCDDDKYGDEKEVPHSEFTQFRGEQTVYPFAAAAKRGLGSGRQRSRCIRSGTGRVVELLQQSHDASRSERPE